MTDPSPRTPVSRLRSAVREYVWAITGDCGQYGTTFTYHTDSNYVVCPNCKNKGQWRASSSPAPQGFENVPMMGWGASQPEAQEKAMAAVEITITGTLYDKLNRTTQQVVLIGEASLTGLGIGGGPIIPPGRPVDPGAHPEHPIVLPPDPNAPRPSHPIALPGDPWWPSPPVDPPQPPDMVKPPPPEGGWAYSPEWGWGYYPKPGEAGPKK